MKPKTRNIVIICLVILAVVIFIPKLFPYNSGSIFTWLILLLCPLMHFFMMRGMNHGGDNNQHNSVDHNGHTEGHDCCAKDKK